MASTHIGLRVDAASFVARRLLGLLVFFSDR